MFTFSFSSAFAVTDSDDFETAVAAYKGALNYDGNGYLVSDTIYTAWAGIISKAILETAIDNWAVNVDLNDVTYVTTGALNSDALDNMKEAIKVEVNENQYAQEMDELNALIASIDLTAYNTTGKAALESAIQTAEDAVVDAPKQSSGIKTINTATSDLKSAITANKANLKTEAAETLAETIADLEKKLEERSDNFYLYAKDWFAANTVTNAAQVAAKTTFDADFNNVVNYLADVIDTYEAAKVAGTSTIITPNYINIVTDWFFKAENPVAAGGKFQTAVSYLAQNDVWTAYYEKQAENAKAAMNADGTKTYYAVDVDNLLADTMDALADDLWTAYSTGSFTTTASTEWTNGLAAIANKTYELQAYRAAAEDKFTTGSYALTNWVGARADKVEAVQEEYAEKVLLATTIEEIDALVKEAKAAIDAVMTKAEVNSVASKVASRIKAAGFLTTCSATTDGKGKIATASGDGFDSYFRVVVGSTTTYKPATKAAAIKAAAQVFVDAVLAEEDDDITYKQIDTIIAANKTAAYDKLAEVKTAAELKAEATAVTTLINALPKTVTIADKDQVLAAQAAMDAYLDNAGAAQADVSKYGTLKSALTTIINAENTAVAKLIRALPTSPSVADEEKIVAARAAYDALEDAYEDYVGTALTTATLTSDARLETAEANLETAKFYNVAKLIGALTTTSTEAEVEAVKAAYDALETESKLALNDELYNKLMSAVEAVEAAKAAAEEAEKEALIASVEGLKIKANSSAKKGSITVKWTVTGDDSNVEKYQVYKSTKAQKGYKKAITTTKTSFKNTKNLEKGTRYYYKVRAFVTVDGVKYYSDWSNKANRIAK